MTESEKKRLPGLVFIEIRADHIEGGGVVLTFKPRPEWEPYVDSVMATMTADTPGATAVATSERKTGVKHAEVVTTRLVQDEHGWLRAALVCAREQALAVDGSEPR